MPPTIKASRKGVAASHRHSPKQEKATAKRLGGARISGSGSGDTRGDVRVRGVVRVENKCTVHDSFSITQEMLNKIETASMAAGELPAVEVQFVDRNGRVKRSVAVVPTWVLDAIVQGNSNEPA